MTYDELLIKLKSLNNKKQQVDILMQYLLENMQYDYPFLEKCRFDQNFVGYIDQNFNPASVTDRQRVKLLLESKGYSNEFIARVFNNYGAKIHVDALPGNDGKNGGMRIAPRPAYDTYLNFGNALNLMKSIEEYKDGILIKGICADFSQFINKVCDELNIDSFEVNGETPVLHAWNAIDVGDGYRHYDLTYALYSRDGNETWKNTDPNKWFGVSTDQLFEIHHNRKIYKDFLVRLKSD